MTYRHEISNSDDVIDSRDVIERIEELEAMDGERDDDENAELAALKALEDEAKDCSEDWSYGSTLIRDDYFTEYTQVLLEDVGDLPKNLPHYIAIDWETTARNIQVDYTSVDFSGVTYWVR